MSYANQFLSFNEILPFSFCKLLKINLEIRSNKLHIVNREHKQSHISYKLIPLSLSLFHVKVFLAEYPLVAQLSIYIFIIIMCLLWAAFDNTKTHRPDRTIP